ncbi:MAG: DCC1-like thiol-disulfide oxidoreductase family protein [Pseudomonadota bacterium]
MLGNTTAYSFIEDPLVPRFEVPPRFTVMDAHCALCARGARWIAKNDRDMLFRIVPAHTALGEALLRHYGMDPADPTTWLYVEDGCAYSALDALVRVGCALGGVWRALAVLRILPPRWQDALYGAVARRRIQLFGSADLCALPDAQVQRRLLL